MQSKITQGPTTYLFTAKVLNKHDVKFYRCNQTGFIQTEEPHWLAESYSSAITKLDVGLPYRNIQLADKVYKVIGKSYNAGGRFLDYAGGYGLFTRLMRDKGFNFYHTDQYCQNLFAEFFDLTDLPDGTRFELTTAFEVFEHLTNPVEEIKAMLQHSDNLLFTTELQPKGQEFKSTDDWWYFIPETGQHVAFYTEHALRHIAEQLGYFFHTDSVSLHLFSKKKFKNNPLVFGREPFLVRKARKFIKGFERDAYGSRESLLMQDWQHIKEKLK